MKKLKLANGKYHLIGDTLCATAVATAIIAAVYPLYCCPNSLVWPAARRSHTLYSRIMNISYKKKLADLSLASAEFQFGVENAASVRAYASQIQRFTVSACDSSNKK